KTKLKSLRGLPQIAKNILEQLPAASHPMDVLRTYTSIMGTILPEKEDRNLAGCRDLADMLMASYPSALLYWYHYSRNGKRITVESDEESIAGHFLYLLHGEKPSKSWVDAVQISLN